MGKGASRYQKEKKTKHYTSLSLLSKYTDKRENHPNTIQHADNIERKDYAPKFAKINNEKN
jgi:hypothetical protein